MTLFPSEKHLLPCTKYDEAYANNCRKITNVMHKNKGNFKILLLSWSLMWNFRELWFCWIHSNVIFLKFTFKHYLNKKLLTYTIQQFKNKSLNQLSSNPFYIFVRYCHTNWNAPQISQYTLKTDVDKHKNLIFKHNFFLLHKAAKSFR